MRLSNEQQLALDTAITLRDAGRNMLLILGKGGTGKSKVAHDIIKAFGVTPEELEVTATTHQAAGSLESLDSTCNEVGTIQALMKMRVTDTNEVKSLARAGDVDLEETKLIVVDEVSFLQKALVRRIEKVAEANPHVFWLFLGDMKQATVVMEGLSHIFYIGIPEVTLIKNWRQKEKSRVNVTVQEVRDLIEEKIVRVKAGKNIKVGPLYFNKEEHEDGSIYPVTGAVFNKLFVQHCMDDPETRCIAWRNKIVNSYCNMVRAKLHPQRPLAPFYVGEKILAGAELIDFDEGLRICRAKRRGKVLDIRPVETSLFLATEWGLQVSGYSLLVEFENMAGNVFVPDIPGQKVIKERSLLLYKHAKLVQSADRWATYHRFNGNIADVRHIWAYTSHSIQGTTLGKTVFIDGSDMNRIPNPLEKLTLWNVALGRTVQDVYIKQAKPRGIQ